MDVLQASVLIAILGFIGFTLLRIREELTLIRKLMEADEGEP